MKPNQLIAAAIREMRDVALCPSCNGVLDFVTNGFGGVIQRCSRCGRQGQMQLAPKREITEERQWRGRVQEGKPCIDCGQPTAELHGGRHADRCYTCRGEHNRAVAREWQRTHRRSA